MYQPKTGMTVEEAREYIFANRDHGVKCPVCLRLAKVYRNPLNSSMALVLIHLRNHYRALKAYPFIHVPSFINTLPLPSGVTAAIRGHWPKLRYWGLIVEKDATQPDGNPRAGYWCITQAGLDYAEAKGTLPCAAFVYQKECLGFDTSKYVTIQQALKKKFNYSELMAG